MSLSEDLDQVVKNYSIVQDLRGVWPAIDNAYAYYGFTDHLTDGEKINEYKWIAEQYRKYVFTKQATIEEAKGDPYRLLNTLNDLLSKGTIDTTSRKHMAYAMLRDDYLYSYMLEVQSVIDEYQEEML